MSLKFMGKKRGMIQIFDKQGRSVPCTIIEAGANIVTQIKTKETDGYNAVQLGFEKVTAKDPRRQKARTPKPQRGHFEKAGVEACKYTKESRVENPNEYQVGQALTIESFKDIKFIDATAYSKGKGFQGVMKKYNFAGGPASHGSGFHRHAGSTGMRSTPGRCFPGGKRASRMGYQQVTVQNLEVVMVRVDDNLILVRGAVPGPNNGLVYFGPAVKKSAKQKKH